MSRSPIYETRSTRALQVRRPSRRVPLLIGALAALAVILAGAVLGRGWTLSNDRTGAKEQPTPRATRFNPTDERRIIVQALRGTPTARLPDPVTPTPTATPPLPTATAEPIPTAPPTVAQSPPVGSQFEVYNTLGLGLFLRPLPTTSSVPLKTLYDGTVVIALGEDAEREGRTWRHVRDPEGTEGWVAVEYLRERP